jgi:putative flippase GtrA
MFRLKKKQQKEVTRIVEYMVSGGAYFWSGYLVFFLLDKVFHATFFWAKSVSTLVGWVVNYILQRYWAFDNPRLKAHQTEVTGRYAVITLTDFVLDFLIVWGLKEVGVTPYIGQFISAGFFTVWNYLWYRYWVFPDKFTSRKPSKITVPRVLAHRAHGQSAFLTLRGNKK